LGAALDQLCERLRRSCDAESAHVLDETGKVIAGAGPSELLEGVVASAGGWSAVIAAEQETLADPNGTMLCLHQLADDRRLAVTATRRSSVGLVRQRMRKASAEIGAALRRR